MASDIININSISDLHEGFGFEKPTHPLISIIDASKLSMPKNHVGKKVMHNLYMISRKDKSCGVDHGRNSLDFGEGVMVFSTPGQIYSLTHEVKEGDLNGWLLYFHPDLIRNTHLNKIIEDYSFFNYNDFEALHLSGNEEETLNNCATNIKAEYEQRIDNHSQRVIVSNLELLLNYALRYYERQFNTRTSQSKSFVKEFNTTLRDYFSEQKNLEFGLPSIQYFSDKANLSQHYFSDLIKKETGQTPKDHINDFVVNKAKNLLLESKQSVSEIAYDLGFNYPHYFTRLFKSKTGQTPVEYRSLN